MPLYEYRCKKCKQTTLLISRDNPLCELCDVVMARKYSLYVKPMFKPHFNHAVGKYVTSQSQFNQELERKSAEQTERTGIYHNYVPVETGDRDAFGATEESMDDFDRFHHNNPDAIHTDDAYAQ